jgi:N-acyl-D-amino-acid deacylase
MASYHATFYKHPVASVGLDTTVVDYQWDSQVPPWSAHGINGFSAFVGFFDKFVNKQNELTLEQAVCKSSTQTAKRFNLKGRGVIREGSYADIVLMDLPNLEVVGTPLDPKQQPKGINYVFVNGIAVVKNAKHTGATPGRVLRRE